MNRANITLYIGTQIADLSDDSLVQMNYTADDLTSPAAVKNSYSQQVKLPGTARNDAIFGAIYRADWWPTGAESYTGTGFDPLIRTPFALYDETGALLESGYLKLNSITAHKSSRLYTVTLYGGLGSFFYSLTYNDQGEEMTLGALPFIDDVQGVGFAITKETVAAAWQHLAEASSGNVAIKWDVVNFAPAYNGLPEGDFSADKAIGNPVAVGGVDSTAVDGVTYTTYGPNQDALFELGEDFTEWQTKDLRSYLQRPVVSVRGLLAGITTYAARKGFTLELDPAFFANYNPYFANTWMTLPLLAGRSQQGTTGEYSAEAAPLISNKVGANQYAEPLYTPITLPQLTPGASVTVTSDDCLLLVAPPSGISIRQDKIWFNTALRSGFVGTPLGTIAFVQLQLCDATGSPLSASPIQVCLSNNYNVSTYTTEQIVDLAKLEGCVKKIGGVAESIIVGSLYKSTIPIGLGQVDMWEFSGIDPLTATGLNFASARVCVEFRTLLYDGDMQARMTTAEPLQYNLAPDISFSSPSWLGTMGFVGAWVRDVSVSYATQESFRSGVEVTQEALFADTMTPAAFLLSYTKTFGLQYLYDKGTKTVRIVSRNTLYDGQTLDMQERIDRAREIVVSPLTMTSKWLSFAPQDVEGEFVAYYKQKRGAVYGAQKVNTGFDFDANTVEVLESVELNGGAEVLEKSRYFNNVTRAGIAVPSPFLNGQATYTLYHNGDREQSTDLEGLTPDYTAKVAPFNASLPSYDIVPKLQAHGPDNSGNEGGGVLLFLRGNISTNTEAAAAYARFRITDDTQTMYDLNDGEPCWDLTGGIPATYMPIFGRFYRRGEEVVYTQDLGTPAEIDIPAIRIGADSNVFAQFWRRFIADRYNVATRVLTAYVDWRGVQVDESLLRHFYSFDGALWVLNKIVNYAMALTTTTKCEFVKIQDVAAYTSGQMLPTAPRLYLYVLGSETTPQVVEVPTDGAENYIVSLRSNGTVIVREQSPELKVIIGGGVATVAIPANTTTTARNLTVDFGLVEDAAISRVLILRQEPAYYLRLDGVDGNITRSIEAAGGTITIPIDTNGTPRVLSTSAGLTATITGGSLVLDVAANSGASTEIKTVSLDLAEDDIERTVTVNQAAAAVQYTLTIDGKAGSQSVFFPGIGGTKTYSIESNGTPYIASSSIVPASNAHIEAGQLVVTLPQNTGSMTLVNNIEVSVQEAPTVTATLILRQLGTQVRPPVESTEADGSNTKGTE